MTNILLTGATGHAGSHLAERIIRMSDWGIVSLQRLPGPGPDMLGHLDASRIRKVYHDFRAPLTDRILKEIGTVKYIVHNGAVVPNAATVSSNPSLSVETNAVGTFNMLEAARKLSPEKFLYTSTGQVLGPCALPLKEDAPFAPPHVYAATKAAGELLVNSYHKSFGVPTITTRVMNLFGERQQASKFVTGTLARILRGEKITLNADITGQTAYVQWLHASTYAAALLFLLEAGTIGETYHVAGTTRSIQEMATRICHAAGCGATFEQSKKAYLEKYALDGSKLEALGWFGVKALELQLEETIHWTIQHPEWMV